MYGTYRDRHGTVRYGIVGKRVGRVSYRTVRDGTVPYGNVISYRWRTVRYRTVL